MAWVVVAAVADVVDDEVGDDGARRVVAGAAVTDELTASSGVATSEVHAAATDVAAIATTAIRRHVRSRFESVDAAMAGAARSFMGLLALEHAAPPVALVARRWMYALRHRTWLPLWSPYESTSAEPIERARCVTATSAHGGQGATIRSGASLTVRVRLPTSSNATRWM